MALELPYLLANVFSTSAVLPRRGFDETVEKQWRITAKRRKRVEKALARARDSNGHVAMAARAHDERIRVGD